MLQIILNDLTIAWNLLSNEIIFSLWVIYVFSILSKDLCFVYFVEKYIHEANIEFDKKLNFELI